MKADEVLVCLLSFLQLRYAVACPFKKVTYEPPQCLLCGEGARKVSKLATSIKADSTVMLQALLWGVRWKDILRKRWEVSHVS